MIPFGLKGTAAYADAVAAVKGQRIDYVVGHSLGAAVAAELAPTLGALSVGFGSPVKNDINYADRRDIVGLFVESEALTNTQNLLHHGIQGYIRDMHGR